MIKEDKELQDAFFEETIEHIDKLEKEMLELENNIDDRELINSIFRSFHTIKASAAYMNFNNLKDISHKIENLLDKIRRGDNKINTSFFNILLKSIDVMRELVDNNDKSSKLKELNELIENINLSSDNINKNFTFTKKEKESNEDDDMDENDIKDKYLIFQIANANFAINLYYIEEITRLRAGTFLPYVERYITSLMNIRGELVPLIDLRIKFNLRRKFLESSRIVILKYKDSLIGLKVDSVKFILTIAEENIKLLNKKFKDFNSDYIKGFFMYKDRPIIILNLDTLLKRGDSNERY